VAVSAARLRVKGLHAAVLEASGAADADSAQGNGAARLPTVATVALSLLKCPVRVFTRRRSLSALPSTQRHIHTLEDARTSQNVHSFIALQNAYEAHCLQASFAASERRYVTELETTEWSVRTSLIAQLARLVLFHDALLVATRPVPPPERAAAAAAAPPPPYTFDRIVPLNAVHILEPDGTHTGLDADRCT
jgi:hypothetical protein